MSALYRQLNGSLSAIFLPAEGAHPTLARPKKVAPKGHWAQNKALLEAFSVAKAVNSGEKSLRARHS